MMKGYRTHSILAMEDNFPPKLAAPAHCLSLRSGDMVMLDGVPMALVKIGEPAVSQVAHGTSPESADETACLGQSGSEFVDVPIRHDPADAGAMADELKVADGLGAGIDNAETKVRYVDFGFRFTFGVENIACRPENGQGERDGVARAHDKGVLLSFVVFEDGDFAVMTSDGRVPTFGELQNYAFAAHNALSSRASLPQGTVAETGGAASPAGEVSRG